MNLQHPTIDQITLSNVLAALGDPTRLSIVAELARKGDGPVSCSHFLMFTSKTRCKGESAFNFLYKSVAMALRR